MKTLASFTIALSFVFGFVFAKDEMNLQLVKRRNLGKHLNLKAEKVAKAKTKVKKGRKKGNDINAMFANVEYNSGVPRNKRKRIKQDDFFTELKDLSDLDQVDKYEAKFVSAESKRARARRKTSKKNVQVMDFTAQSEVNKPAENTKPIAIAKKSAAKSESFSEQAGGSNLKGLVKGSVKGTTFDTYDAGMDEAVTKEATPIEAPASSTQVAQSYSTQKFETYPNPGSKSSSWLTLAPVGGYGVVSLANSQDNFNRGAKEWEASDTFGGGVLADLGRGRWQFETGLLYVRTGVKREINQMSLYGVGDNSLEYLDRDYIALPLVGIYNFMDKSASSIFAKAGLWPMFLTSAKRETFSATMPDASGDVSDLQQKYEMLAILGLGGRIKVSNAMAIVIEGYFLRGINDTFNTNQMSGYTQGFMGNVGISFDL